MSLHKGVREWFNFSRAGSPFSLAYFLLMLRWYHRVRVLFLDSIYQFFVVRVVLFRITAINMTRFFSDLT